MATFVDPRADVSPEAELGNDVRVGPFAVVEAGAVIGDRSTVASHTLIASGARIGKECVIHHGAVVGHAPQDLKYANEPTICEIGDRTIVREFATLHRGTGEHGHTKIGSDCFLMGFVHIAHDCHLGDHVIMANAAMMAGHCEVGDWVTIGGITPIHQFVHIGQHAMVGGGIRVPKDVPPYVLASGDPASFEGLNSIGLRRRGFSPQVLDALDRAYLILFRSKLNVSQAVARIASDTDLMTFQEVRNILEFIRTCKRGLFPGSRPHR
jgi:UDP-N-acetylglucosamine acyltransferase